MSKGKEMPWSVAVLTVMQELKGPVHYKEIAEEIAKRKLRTSLGATPAQTVNATNFQANAKDANYGVVGVGKGFYQLKDKVGTSDLPVAKAEQVVEAAAPDSEVNVGLIRSFGIYWRAELVDWKSSPKLLGAEQDGAAPVDFSEQRGVYILYDRNRVLYVGRVVDRGLGQRLYQHTKDRLTGRWDRFSWFGLRPVLDDASLGEIGEVPLKADFVIATLEALLIEALEPAQNRRGGDQFAVYEYLQVTDPAIAVREDERMVMKLIAKLKS